MAKRKVPRVAMESLRHRIVWSETEKQTLISTAVQIQRVRPDLSGLPLLRQAIGRLPRDRQRKVIALSHVPWFEPGVIAEAARLAAQDRPSEPTPVVHIADPNDPYLPVLSAFRDILDRHHETSKGLLEEIRDEIRQIRRKVFG
jgi:hypothetical protein